MRCLIQIYCNIFFPKVLVVLVVLVALLVSGVQHVDSVILCTPKCSFKNGVITEREEKDNEKEKEQIERSER